MAHGNRGQGRPLYRVVLTSDNNHPLEVEHGPGPALRAIRGERVIVLTQGATSLD